MDWDKLRVFHAAAELGSFTRAAEALDMSQSAVSRQVSAVERDLNVPLFHRHARGLMLTEHGEILYHAAHDMMIKLDVVRGQLMEARDKPSGTLRVTTTVGLGSTWLTDRMHEFVELYPDISLQLILENEELDLSMRQADVGSVYRNRANPTWCSAVSSRCTFTSMPRKTISIALVNRVRSNRSMIIASSLSAYRFHLICGM